MAPPLTVEVNLDADEFHTEISKLPGKADKIATAVGAAWAGAAVGIAAAAVKMAGDFEHAMAAVDTKLDKTAKTKLPQLKKAIMDLPPELGEATDLARGLTEALDEGANAADAMEILTQSARLSKAAMSDLSETTKGMTRLMNAYGKESASAGELSAWMFETGDVDELAAGIGKVASNAALAGISQKELLSGLALLKDRGMSAEEAMKAMSSAVRGFLDPGDKAREVAEGLGIQGFGRAQIEAKGFVGALEEIDQKTGGSVEQIGLLFGSVENAAGVTKLAADNASDYKDKIEAMGGAAAKQDAAFLAMTSTFNAKMESLKVAIDKLMIGLGDEWLPKITKVVETLLRNIDSVKIALEAIVAPVKLAWGLGEFLGTKGAQAAQAAGAMAAEGEQAGSIAVPLLGGSAPGLGGKRMKRGFDPSKFQDTGNNPLAGISISGDAPIGFGGSAEPEDFVGFSMGGPPSPAKAAANAGIMEVVTGKGAPTPGPSGASKGGKGPTDAQLYGMTTLPGGAGYGSDSSGPQSNRDANPFEVIKDGAAKAADAGLKEGTGSGATKGSESIYKKFLDGSSKSLVDAFMSDDVKGGIKAFGQSLADTAKSMLGSALSSLLSGLLGGGGGFLGGMFKAEGGPVTAGTPYIVGERRPEVFVPKTNGTILPRVPEGMGGSSIHIENLNLSAGPGGVQSIQDIERELSKLARTGQSSYFPRQIQAARS